MNKSQVAHNKILSKSKKIFDDHQKKQTNTIANNIYANINESCFEVKPFI